MKTISKISFNYQVQNFSFPQRKFVKHFVLQIFELENTPISHINYTFCSDDYLLPINKQYLNHDTLTDIITFELSNINEPIIGDIYISIDRLKENSKVFRTFFYNELLRVIFHGALHLCGYKDKSANEAFIMRTKEDFYLNKYFVSRGTL